MDVPTPIEFRVLGPVEAVRGRETLALGGRRQRALLALLVLDAGRVVSSDRLIDELWHGRPPAGAVRTLRVYASRLRSALGENAVLARSRGYLVAADADRIDAARFERLLHEGRDALGRGAAGLAADRLTAGLALWRGAALGDVADDGILALEARRLDGLRLVCREELVDAELALGRHKDVVAELERLVVEQPLRERLWRQLVTALYRSERQADALAAYRRARTQLADELGLEPSDELRELERAVLRHEVGGVPPEEERHNLPSQVTTFVGRERELEELGRVLREHRLVTLTGMGGAGKTRLALEAASRQVRAWPHGVWLVDLVPLADSEAVAAAVAVTLGVVDRPDAPPVEGVLHHLRPLELLLVLDNCEHVVTACAALTHEILRACPGTRVLATSRIPLGVHGELDYAVEPLPVPAEATHADQVERVASVELFLDRARAARRDVGADDRSLATIARICRELDGLPLAIELAAARSKLLALDDIAARLDDRFRFLRSWTRIADPRHQTLHATIDWSYELLSDEERALLAQLSVFAGGFGLDAVAAVCHGGDDDGALELIGRLVDSSLVVAEGRPRLSRFRLLETIHEYAAERLAGDLDAGDELRRSHAEYFLELARRERTDPQRPTEDAEATKHAVLARLDQERENLHAAVGWALAGENDLALPLCAALWRYWLLRGYRRQGLEWLERALALPAESPPPLRAIALAGAALLARLGGRFDRARALAEEGVSLARTVGPPPALAISLNVLVTLAGLAGDYERARALSDESVAVARQSGDRGMEAIAHFILAEAALHDGRRSDAVDAGARAVALAREVGDPEILAIALGRLGMAKAAAGPLLEARAQLGEALEYAAALDFKEVAAWCCEGLAVVAGAAGDSTRAARLLGAAETLRIAGGGTLLAAEAAARAAAVSAIRERLQDAELEAELERGRRMTLEEARGYARGLSV